MAQPSDAPLFPPFSVIGPQFIAPYPLEITVDKYPCRHLVITDSNHKIMLKVKPYDTTFHRQRILLDANDKPIAMLREKGESKADSDMIFSAKTEHMIQFKTNVSMTLANKKNYSDDCDLRLKGSWSKKNCTIYMGDSSIAIAQYATDKFTVTIQPNMDYACVIALLAIVDATENSDEIKEGSSEVGGAVLDVCNVLASS
ncbi:hypothetical protein L1987_73334 [Smallanthus sonchifolius]|uniref:Uncharacterized protein n=1 Tax=Smallanthus sonchifolius TaxID=185202 RepID=A0ACB9A1P2_9ASTR|nr:hypothetical protein L1987_73334 [Smallanthus sonchifolius]